jgi:hypothetical protein
MEGDALDRRDPARHAGENVVAPEMMSKLVAAYRGATRHSRCTGGVASLDRR